MVRSIHENEQPIAAPGNLLREAIQPNKWMHVRLLPELSYSAPKDQAQTPVLKRYMPGTDLAMVAYRQSPQLAHFFSPASNPDQRAAIRFRFTF